MSQPDAWLLIHGREKAKLVVASNTALLSFSINAEIKYILAERVLASYQNLHYIV